MIAQTKGRKRQVTRIVTKALRYKLKGNNKAMMATVADGFLELGGIYVKFLQGVLLQIPELKGWHNDKRLDVYENVPSTNIDVIHILRTELPREKLGMIAAIEPQPFAAGSFGQVYMASLADGQRIIVKVLRPGARRILKEDLRLIKVVARLLSGIVTNLDTNIKSLTQEFIKNTLGEVDYVKEAEFASELYLSYKNHPLIVVPQTYLELCTENIIVQEFVEGLSLVDLLRDSKSLGMTPANLAKQRIGSDLRDQLSRLGVEMYIRSIIDEPFHGDPHPGNIRLLADNKIGLIDFGIKARPSLSPRAYYLIVKEYWRAETLRKPDPGAMFTAYIRFYSESLYESMRVISKHLTKHLGKPVELEKYVTQLANTYFKNQVSETQLQQGLDDIRDGKSAPSISVMRVINADNRFKLFAKVKDGPMLRAMLTYISLITELGCRDIIPKVYADVMEHVKRELPHLENEAEPRLDLSQAIEVLYEWLDEIAKTDFDLYKKLMAHIQGFSPLLKLK